MGRVVADRALAWLALALLVSSPLLALAWFLLCAGAWS